MAVVDVLEVIVKLDGAKVVGALDPRLPPALAAAPAINVTSYLAALFNIQGANTAMCKSAN